LGHNPVLQVALIHLPILIYFPFRVFTRSIVHLDEQFVFINGPFWFVEFALGFAYNLALIGIMIVHRRREKKTEAGLRATLALSGSIAVMVSSVVELLFPTSDAFFSSLGMGLMGTIFAVGVLKYRMFEMQRLFQQGLAATLTSIVLWFMFNLLEAGLQTLFSSIFASAANLTSNIVGLLVITLMLVPVHRVFRNISQRLYPLSQGIEIRLRSLGEQSVDVSSLEQLLLKHQEIKSRGQRKAAEKVLGALEAQLKVLEIARSAGIPDVAVVLRLDSDLPLDAEQPEVD